MWRFAIQNLVSRPLRSLLALAGLSVAIAGMVGLFSVAEGIDRMVTDTFSRIPGLAMMQAGAPLPLFSRMPAAWAEEIEQRIQFSTVLNELLLQTVKVFSKLRIETECVGNESVSNQRLQLNKVLS